jgi:hypothetical protein
MVSGWATQATSARCFGPNALGDSSECKPFRVGKPQAPGEVTAENPILRYQVFTLEEQVLVGEAGDVRQ